MRVELTQAGLEDPMLSVSEGVVLEEGGGVEPQGLLGPFTVFKTGPQTNLRYTFQMGVTRGLKPLHTGSHPDARSAVRHITLVVDLGIEPSLRFL